MNAPLIVAGALALLGAAIHGVGGEVLVVRKLSPEVLPATQFGGPRTTMAMIHATWHLTSIAFIAVGVAALVAGAALKGDEARAIAVVAAGASTGFAAVVVGLAAADAKSLRTLLRHPGPLVLTTTAALAWWGAL